MSFGFGVGDFIAVGELAFKIHTRLVKVAKNAPRELQILTREVTVLWGMINTIGKDLEDPESVLSRAGPDRIQMVLDILTNVKEMLSEMEKMIDKYRPMAKTDVSRVRTLLNRGKWALDVPAVESLRSKTVFYSTQLTLIAACSGASSLERIDTITRANQEMVAQIEGIMSSLTITTASQGQSTQRTYMPEIKGLQTMISLDSSQQVTLGRILNDSAEEAQPWDTISAEKWVQAAKWWLKQAEMGYETTGPTYTQVLSEQCYANLIKAYWIVADVLHGHPQRLQGRTQTEIELLSKRIKHEFNLLRTNGMAVPNLQTIRPERFRIWETPRRSAALVSADTWRGTLGSQLWFRDNERIFFSRPAKLTRREIEEPVSCIVFATISVDTLQPRLIALDQDAIAVLDMTIEKTSKVTLDLRTYTALTAAGMLKFDHLRDITHLFAVLDAMELFVFFREREEHALSCFECYLVVAIARAGDLQRLPKAIDGDAGSMIEQMPAIQEWTKRLLVEMPSSGWYGPAASRPLATASAFTSDVQSNSDFLAINNVQQVDRFRLRDRHYKLARLKRLLDDASSAQRWPTCQTVKFFNRSDEPIREWITWAIMSSTPEALRLLFRHFELDLKTHDDFRIGPCSPEPRYLHMAASVRSPEVMEAVLQQGKNQLGLKKLSYTLNYPAIAYHLDCLFRPTADSLSTGEQGHPALGSDTADTNARASARPSLTWQWRHQTLHTDNSLDYRRFTSEADFLEFCQSFRSTALECAVAWNNSAVAVKLLGYSKHLDFRLLRSPLDLAIACGNLQLTELLLNAGASVGQALFGLPLANIPNNRGIISYWSSLALSVHSGSEDLFQLVLSCTSKPRHIQSAFLVACQLSQLSTMEVLLGKGATVNGIDGENPSSRNLSHSWALTAAAFSGKFDTVRWLVQKCPTNCALMSTMNDMVSSEWNGHGIPESQQQILEWLTEQIPDLADISAEDGDYDVAFALIRSAIRQEHLTIAEKLVHRGLDLAICERRSGTSLVHILLQNVPLYDLSGKGEQHGILELLIEGGADGQAVNAQGKTALHITARRGWVDSVRILLRSGVTVDVKDLRGTTARDEVLAGLLIRSEAVSDRNRYMEVADALLGVGPIDHTDNTVAHLLAFKAGDPELNGGIGSALRYISTFSRTLEH